ncbi:MAG: OmpA family protein [Longimonas sp.]|uniref:OmpA family protein n=1 Tax=Longimonas sp. TaxID=2039626 RepID=UPI00336312D7
MSTAMRYPSFSLLRSLLSPLRTAAFVMGVVMLGGCSPEADVEALEERIQALEDQNVVLEERLAEARDSLNRLQQSAPSSMTQLGDPVRFPSGSAWIPDQGRRTLDSLATILQDQYDSRDFRIKGFTDSMPIGPSLRNTYPSNWYLSAQRAAAVAHYLDDEHGVRSRTLEVGAFGPQNPVATNETVEGRRMNRRVEIQVTDD